MTTHPQSRATLGGRMLVLTDEDLDTVATVADEFHCSLECLIAAAQGDGEPLTLGESE